VILASVPESALPRLFDRFFISDPARTHAATTLAVETPAGSGLAGDRSGDRRNSLSQIQAESTLTQGTTFTVTLPWC